MAKDNLVKIGGQWYLRISIPRSIRHLFLSSKGKPKDRIVEPMGDSLSVAKIRAAQRTAICVEVFEQVRAGVLTDPEQITAALRGPGKTFAEAVQEARSQWLAGHGVAASLYPHVPYRDGIERPTTAGETIGQALEAWIQEMERDKTVQPLTIDGHRRNVNRFIKYAGDIPVNAVDKAKASDFLSSLNVATGTRRSYAISLKCLFNSAGDRGRFTGKENPFGGKKKKGKSDSYVPFEVPELQKICDNLSCEIAPTKHTPDTALPWVARIALYTGMRLEEIAQLTTADIRQEGDNGATVWVIDVHKRNGNRLKNDTSVRLVPIHRALVRAGFLDYVKALPPGPLFPGLKRRASKGGKISARLGELFRKLLVRLGIKRKGLCFHSFRHTVGTALDRGRVQESDSAWILGHAHKTESRRTYSEGPGVVHLKDEIDKIVYEGLRV